MNPNEKSHVMPKSFIITDESLNNHGFWLPLAGAELDQFRKNPIMLWMHKRPSTWNSTQGEVLPIGYWDNIRIEGDKLLADPVFDENDEFAMKIADKVEHGTLRMASAGIKVIETSVDVKNLKPGQTTETPIKWCLREASIVDIGANNNSLALAFYDDNDELINLSDGKTTIPLRKITEINNNPTNEKMTENKRLAKILGLAEEATVDQVATKAESLTQDIQRLTNEKTNLETRLADLEKKDKDEKKAKAIILVDAAIKAGRIDATAKESWKKFFETNHELADSSLAAIPARTSARQQLEGGAAGTESERSALEKLSWDELDRSGKLITLSEKYPDMYEQKFETKFGRKPNKK